MSGRVAVEKSGGSFLGASLGIYSGSEIGSSNDSSYGNVYDELDVSGMHN